MGNRTAGRAFEKRMRNFSTGIYTLLAISIQIGALLFVAVWLPPQVAAWRSRHMTEDAQALVEKNKVFEAQVLLHHAVALDPTNPFAHFNLGVLELAVNGDPLAAEDDFERAVEIDGGFARAYYNLGVLRLFYLQKQRLACDNLKRAVALDAAYAPGFAALGLAHESLGEYGSARDAYDRYLKLDAKGPWSELVKQHRHAIAGLPAADELSKRMREGDDVFEIVAVGDISLARGVNVDLYTGKSESPLLYVTPWTSRAAIAFGNLESPLTKRAARTSSKGPAGGSIYLKGNPDFTFLLTEAGFDVLSLANNHIMDYGDQGLADTTHYLDQEEIKHAGAGVDLAAATAPAEVDLDGYKVHFLAFSGVEPKEYYAGPGKPGAAPLDEATVTAAIARSSSQANLVVVSLHWGEESMPYPTSEEKRLAHKFVDAGADIIIGHHPHVVQGVESYENAVIAYSLGNFLFDSQYLSRHYSTLLTVEVSRSKGVLGFRLIPIYIEGTTPTVGGGAKMTELMDFALVSAAGKRQNIPAPAPPAGKRAGG